jgi:hypothetical protein
MLGVRTCEASSTAGISPPPERRMCCSRTRRAPGRCATSAACPGSEVMRSPSRPCPPPPPLASNRQRQNHHLISASSPAHSLAAGGCGCPVSRPHTSIDQSNPCNLQGFELSPAKIACRNFLAVASCCRRFGRLRGLHRARDRPIRSEFALPENGHFQGVPYWNGRMGNGYWLLAAVRNSHEAGFYCTTSSYHINTTVLHSRHHVPCHAGTRGRDMQNARCKRSTRLQWLTVLSVSVCLCFFLLVPCWLVRPRRPRPRLPLPLFPDPSLLSCRPSRPQIGGRVGCTPGIH